MERMSRHEWEWRKKDVCSAEDGTFERQGGETEREGNQTQTEKFPLTSSV